MAEDKETRHGGHKNGKKGGLSGSSFFTWFMVIALLGVWTSVAVVWFDLVDYEEVLAKAKDFRYNLSEVLQGKLGIYDADGDGDFDVDDAKILLGLKERSASEPTVPPEEAEPYAEPEEQAPVGAEPQNIEDEVQEQIQPFLHEMVYTEYVEGEDLHQEEGGPAVEPQRESNDFLTATDEDDKFETREPEIFHEDSSEPVVDDERLHHDADDVTYQEYDEQVYEPSENEPLEYEPSENEGIEISDNAVEDSNIISEEISVPPVEEQQEVPPDT
ncbi:aspartyl/asparaginyl beta-hydroxylase isoform h [Daubentonia madagascariensis]|uniref:Aspartyl/asparaginyl beta-hydroxylase isoform h n=1 Tax=Daubentonia madagascariensis TaxID=31869 RepID=A0ABD2DJ29_DAUMA